MRKLTNFLLLLLLWIVVPVHSQTVEDVIELKNGDLLRGTVVEVVPNDYLRMVLVGGSKLTVRFADILRWTHPAPKETGSPPPRADTVSLMRNQRGIQEQLFYEATRKSPTLAVLLSLLLTSTGHAYAGQWERGLLFTAGRIGCAILAFEAGGQAKENTDFRTIGILGFLVLGIWEAIDAADLVHDFNESLRKRGASGSGFSCFDGDVLPSKDGLRISLVWNF